MSNLLLRVLDGVSRMLYVVSTRQYLLSRLHFWQPNGMAYHFECVRLYAAAAGTAGRPLDTIRSRNVTWYKAHALWNVVFMAFFGSIPDDFGDRSESTTTKLPMRNKQWQNHHKKRPNHGESNDGVLFYSYEVGTAVWPREFYHGMKQIRLVHKNQLIRTCLMYHAACEVEFQPFKRSYSQLTIFNFL